MRKKKWKEVKKYRDINMEIEKGIGNGTENEGGRLGALPSTTACPLKIRFSKHKYPLMNCLLIRRQYNFQRKSMASKRL